MDRHSFGQLVSLLKDHSAFQKPANDPEGPKRPPAAHCLLVLVKCHGTEGNQASSKALGNFFGVGCGTARDFRKWALEALLSLEDRTHHWPGAAERKTMSERTQEEWKFPHCVGVVDGTLLPLGCRPLVHGENCPPRKRFYATVMLVACDDRCRIAHCHVGWPGSVHDNRVWRNCALCQKSNECFSEKQCLLGDSAFAPGPTMMPPFKSSPGVGLAQCQAQFNTLLARPRVKSEHCTGTFKGRLPFFRSIRMQFGNKQQFATLLRHVQGGVTLHNFLMQTPHDAEWTHLDEEEEQTTESGHSARLSGVKSNAERRDEIMHCSSELPDTDLC